MSQQLALSIDFGGGFSDAFSKLVSFIPKLIAFCLVLIVGWFVVKLITKALGKVLHSAGFSRLADRSGIGRALENSKYDATGIIVKIIYYTLMLVVLQLALSVFGPNPVSTLLNQLVAWLPKALVAVVIVMVAMAVATAVRDIVGNALSSTSYGRTVATIAWAFIVGLGAIAALGQARIATAITGPLLIAVLAAAAGILVVGVGGGLIMPMRERWERWLTAAERESVNARDSLSAYQRGRADAAAGRPVGQEYSGTVPPRADEGDDMR
ncbi:mechanosensitive ion channel family protein [Streptomyces sp. 184]|uniref:mechanosensitive ion channel family protein n=1 Tax=Streptomyces sp. 184 TaxID=1827526 RepID=UPI0038918504